MASRLLGGVVSLLWASLVVCALVCVVDSSTVIESAAERVQAQQAEPASEMHLQPDGHPPREHSVRNETSRLYAIRLRRQSDGPGGGGGLLSLSGMLGQSCPDKPASENADKPAASVEIIAHRSASKDDISVAAARSGPQFEQAVDRLLREAGFRRDKPTLVYLAGWLQSPRANWLLQAREALDDLAESPANLIIFDYTAYNSFIYARSVSTVGQVGQVLADLLQHLIDRHAYSANKIQIVCYSLSAHIAGVAGRLLRESGRGQLALITAIDPTGVCFHEAKNGSTNSDTGLRASDAKLVLARHYNMKGLGAGRPIGGVDVFVNGGQRQPRMQISDWEPLEVLGSMGVLWAGHHRAVQHEAASSAAYRPTDCHEIAYKCPSLRLFKRGQCAHCGQHNESCLLVSTIGSVVSGFEPQNVNYARGTQMHLMTGVKRFCTFNYQIVARLKRRPPASVLDAFEQGQARFQLMPGLSVAPMYKLDTASQTPIFGGGSSVSFTSLLRLGANRLRLPREIGCPTAELCHSLKSIELNFMSSISPEVRRNNSARYCPGGRADDEPKLVECR